MSLPPQVQTLVDQIVQHLGLQAIRPSSLEINLDGEGIVQDVKPKLTYRRGRVLPHIGVVQLSDGRYINALSLAEISATQVAADKRFVVRRFDGTASDYAQSIQAAVSVFSGRR